MGLGVGRRGQDRHTRPDRRLLPPTTDDVMALVDALEARAMDRIQKSLGRTVLNLAVTWAPRLIFIAAIYSAGASGVLRRLLPA